MLESISANPKFSVTLQKISDWRKKAYNNQGHNYGKLH